MFIGSELKPDYKTNYHSWDLYMGEIWAALLHVANLSTDSVVIEIAPGSSQKIGIALKQSDFSGDLYIVEPFFECLTMICENYGKLLPKAKIYPIHATLHDAKTKLPLAPDFVLSNHPLDDMLLAYKNLSLESMFDWTLASDKLLPNQFMQQWFDLRLSSTKIEAIKNYIVQEWLDFIGALMPRRVIISQYASAFLKNRGLHDLNQYAKDMLYALKNALSVDETIDLIFDSFDKHQDEHIENEVLNARYWLISKPLSW